MDHIPKMLIHVMEEDDIDIKSMVAFDLVQAIRDIETQVVRITEEIDMANDELLVSRMSRTGL